MDAVQTLIPSLIVLYIAKRLGYFRLSFQLFSPPKTFTLFIKNFALFILVTLFTPLLLPSSFTTKIPPSLSLPIILLLILFCFNLQYKPLFFSVLKQKDFPGSKSLFYDALSGIISFAIAIFPYLFINSILMFTVTYFFGPIQEQQLAVEALKANPINLISVIVLAPVLEEFLFRALLQNTLRERLKPTSSIVIASLIFSLFHFSLAQKTLNLVLLPSLFTFSLFLGHIYEKTRSIISNITLHVTFNTISGIYILYFNN